MQVGAATITGRAADVVQAARTAFDVAIRLIKPGKKVGRQRVYSRVHMRVRVCKRAA